MAAEDRKQLIEKIEGHRQAKLICCVTSDRANATGAIAKDFLTHFFSHLRQFGSPDNLDVFLFTTGGDTLAAYALNRFLRRFCKNLGVLIPHWCHSAGTLFALGANQIFMTRLATLSAIDPSIIGPLNPQVEPSPGQRIPVPVGVESVIGFKTAVREDWRLDEEGTALALRQLTERVNPLLLGDLYRSREQIVRLATTLMKKHRPEDEDKIRSIVDTLATKLGSHDYLIGSEEARDLMGTQILGEDEILERLLWDLYSDFAAEMELGTTFNPALEVQNAIATRVPVKRTLRLVVIESLVQSDAWERELLFPLPSAQTQMLRDGWV